LLSMIHNRRSIESGSDQIETEVQTDAESQEGSKKVRKKNQRRTNNLKDPIILKGDNKGETPD